MKTVSKKLLSILLVAILLVSAIPFQAFADPHDHLPDTLVGIGHYDANTTKHWQLCDVDGCPEKIAGTRFNEADHQFGADYICSICRYPCQHPTYTSGACDLCGYACTHPSYTNGVCNVCGMTSSREHDSSHTLKLLSQTAAGHTLTCSLADCKMAGQAVGPNPTAHNWSNHDGVCAEPLCGYHCTHPADQVTDAGYCNVCGSSHNHAWVETSALVNPSCNRDGSTTDGHEAAYECSICHKTKGGVVIPASHNMVDGECTKCGYKIDSDPATIYVTFNATPGEFEGGRKSEQRQVQNGMLVGIPKPLELQNYTFLGWRTANGQLISPNNTANILYDSAMGTTFTAEWSYKTKRIDVFAVKNSDYTKATFVTSYQVPESESVYKYLSDHAGTDISNYAATIYGYSWDGEYRDRNGVTLNSSTANQGQNVYVNLRSASLTLYLDADGGTVAPSSINTSYGSTVTLPTPIKEGKIFGGWKDITPNSPTLNRVFANQFEISMETNMMLKAQWNDKAGVVLRVYMNNQFDSSPHLHEIDNYVVGGTIHWTDIDALLRRNYTAAPGQTLVVNGLFDANTWGAYRANPSQERKNDIHISTNPNETTYVYVMLNGVSTGSIVVPTNPTTPTVPVNGFWVRDLNGNLTWYPAGSTLPAGTGYWVLDASGNPNIWVMTSGSTIPTYIYIGTNPKTGDTAKIEIAAAIMVLAAAALVTVMALRKKKSV